MGRVHRWARRQGMAGGQVQIGLIGIALYFYPAATVRLIAEYLAGGNNPDQPGRFVQWLYPRTPVRTWCVPGTWFDGAVASPRTPAMR